MQANEKKANETQAIRHLQKYLRQLAYFDSDLPLIDIDGRYDPETENAVRIFQRKHDREVTGKVDEKTWDCLYQAYLDSVNHHIRPTPIDILPHRQADAAMSPGQTGFAVEVLQFMLNELSSFIRDMSPLERNGDYDKNTEDDVKAFQQYAGLPQTGMVDLCTWNALANTYNENFRHSNQ